MSELTVTRRLTPALAPEFYQRLLDFYHRQPDATKQLSPLWTVVSGFHHPLVEALNLRDPALLANVLGHLYQNKVMYGLDSSYEHLDCYDLGLGSPEHLTAEYYISASLRLMRQVASNCGAPTPNPEQGTISMSAEEMVEVIETTLGCHLDFPGAGNVSGLVVGDRYIPHKLIDVAGIVATMKRLDCWFPLRVLEIGAGAGWLGYLLHQVDTISYCTFDLPVVSVIQAYMLASSISPGSVALDGERFGNPSQGVCIWGLPGSIDRWREGHYDIVVNQNSFPEIADEQQDAYVKLMERVLRPGGVFLSINHESDMSRQRRTFISMSASPVFKLVHRAPWWNRVGWLEEVWQHR